MDVRSQSFARVLGPWTAGALVVGTMIGTGIFFFVSDVARNLPSPGWVLAVWIFGLLLAVLGGLSLSELASSFPQSGGIYVYLRRAFGPLVAFEYAWTKFLVMRTGSYSIQALAFATFLCGLTGMAPEIYRKPFAIAALVLLCGINMVGVRWGGGVQNILTAIKVAALVTIVMIGAGVALAAGDPVAVVPAATEAGVAGHPLLVAFMLALIPVMWTLGGWDEAPFVAEEIVEPQKNLPRAVIGGLLLGGVLFVLVNAAYLAVLPMNDFVNSGGLTATLFFERTLGPWAKDLLTVVLMISTLGAANGMILTGARIAFATGRDNRIFAWFSHTGATSKTPSRALAAQGLLGCGAILLIPDPFTLLLYTGLAYWGFSALLPLALIILRGRGEGDAGAFRVPFYPVVPLLFGIVACGMCVAVVVNDWSKITSPGSWTTETPGSLVTAVILLVGAAVFYAQRRRS